MIPVRVESYSGYRGEETPRALWLGENRIQVSRLLDRRLSPDHRYFKFIGDDGSLYIIRHDTESWQWELTFFKAEGVDPQ